jgi:hypothetical protein
MSLDFAPHPSTSLVVFLLPCAIASSLYLIGLVPAYGVSFGMSLSCLSFEGDNIGSSF